MAHYLITGGLGFIGSHLAEALLASGHRLRVLDDLSSGRRENLRGPADIIIGDVADPQAVARACRDIDGIFHLAAVASVQRGHEEWLACQRTNAGGTVAILEAARRAPGGPLPVVYASSAAVYGDNRDVPLAETAATVPLSAYGVDKLASEMHARIGSQVHGMPTTGLRFFNVYGPRQDPQSPYSGVIAIFAGRLAAGQPITIFGDGRQSRDFIYVADVVRHLLAAMERVSLAAPVYNVCTGRATDLHQLAATLGDLLGTDPVITYEAPREGDVRHSLGTPDKAIEALGLKAETPLRDGLATTLNWMTESA